VGFAELGSGHGEDFSSVLLPAQKKESITIRWGVIIQCLRCLSVAKTLLALPRKLASPPSGFNPLITNHLLNILLQLIRNIHPLLTYPLFVKIFLLTGYVDHLLILRPG